jgi:hypothetical protein
MLISAVNVLQYVSVGVQAASGSSIDTHKIQIQTATKHSSASMIQVNAAANRCAHLPGAALAAVGLDALAGGRLAACAAGEALFILNTL